MVARLGQLHLLGRVDYAQHNFARLRPLLASEDGRLWTDIAESASFPREGLVFSVQQDLRYAPQDSLWHFHVRENTRDRGNKDQFLAMQAKPAHELLTTLKPLPPEELFQLGTAIGFGIPIPGKGGVLLPEADDCWVLIEDSERGQDGLFRVTGSKKLGRLRAFKGTPEELCGLATTDGRWVLPPILAGKPTELRNWQSNKEFLGAIAKNLRGWVPRGRLHAKAEVAANALRDLIPHADEIAALKADEARAALLRATVLSFDAEVGTKSVREIVAILQEAEPFATALKEAAASVRIELEEKALASVAEVEGAARGKILQEIEELNRQAGVAQERLKALGEEVARLEERAGGAREQDEHELATFGKAIENLIDRARQEPFDFITKFLASRGVALSTNQSGPSSLVPAEEDSGMIVPTIEPTDVGPALLKASPATNDGPPRLLVLDMAIRARELPVASGPMAREFAEAWIQTVGGGSRFVVPCDPTLLTFADFLPEGPRGKSAPLAEVIFHARAQPDRPFVVILDDVDPAAGSYWLPEYARALRQPWRYRLPSNLLALAILEGAPRLMAFTPARASQLFPLHFEDCQPRTECSLPAPARLLPQKAVVEPLTSARSEERINALTEAANLTFSVADAKEMTGGFREFLTWGEGRSKPGESENLLASLLIASASKSISRKSET